MQLKNTWFDTKQFPQSVFTTSHMARSNPEIIKYFYWIATRFALAMTVLRSRN